MNIYLSATVSEANGCYTKSLYDPKVAYYNARWLLSMLGLPFVCLLRYQNFEIFVISDISKSFGKKNKNFKESVEKKKIKTAKNFKNVKNCKKFENFKNCRNFEKFQKFKNAIFMRVRGFYAERHLKIDLACGGISP